MATQKFTTFIILAAFFCTFIMDCNSNSISPAMPPILTGPAPLYPNPTPSFHPFPLRRGVRTAYWPSGNGFPVSSIDTSYFTHIFYAFLLPEPDTFKLNVTTFDQEILSEFTGTLHAANPPTKTLLSIGGGGNDPLVFSKMATNMTTRTIFIDSTINVARKYGFDGLDLDWEFPANENDMSNLALLYKQWRGALEMEAMVTKQPRLLLTSGVYYASKITLLGEPRTYPSYNDQKKRTYPSYAISKYLDWINLMCYDYHGSWDRVTGEHSALFDPSGGNLSTSFGIQSWIQVGVQPKKIVMGLPLYGRTWKLQDPNVHGIGAPAVGKGPGDGILSYSQIRDFISQNNATLFLSPESGCFYAVAGDSWIGYDELETVKLKIWFSRNYTLGGYFFWALGLDKDWTMSKEASDTWGGWGY